MIKNDDIRVKKKHFVLENFEKIRFIIYQKLVSLLCCLGRAFRRGKKDREIDEIL